MGYRPDMQMLWDFWFAPRRADSPYTMFHLEAPADLSDPNQRHGIATIGAAESDDLLHWRRTGTVFSHGEPGSWDDRAIWTGCVIEHDGTYYFFYTALAHAESPSAVQRIGLTTSTDLRTWIRHPGNPIVTADPRWYEQADQHQSGDVACRDPFVIWDDARHEWLMVYCARANSGEADARGVVGAARSRDLLRWEALPPLETPREFGQLEVPQLVTLDGRWYLIFCTFDHSAHRLARTGPSGHWCGTGYLVADDIRGPYRLIDDHPLDGDPHAVWYAGRIETGLTGAPLFFAWLREDADGQFGGILSNPAPVSIAPDGHLSIDVTALHSQ